MQLRGKQVLNRSIFPDKLKNLPWKEVVVAASMGNLDLSSMPATVDGVALNGGDRFLAKDQSTQSQNGIYVFVGAGSAATRTTDADTTDELNRATVSVVSGTTNTGTTWEQLTADPTVGVSNIVWDPIGSILAQQQIYVGKHGNDAYDGKSVERAKLTFGAAITAAGTPASASAAVVIVCFDDGTYTEDIDTPSWVNVHAPDAAINTVAVEGHRIRDYCHWVIGSITCVERAVMKSHNDSAWSVFRCRHIDRTGTNNQPIRCAGGRLIIDVDIITGMGGAVACVADTNGKDAEVHGRIGRVESLSAASTGINCFCTSTGNALCDLRIDSVFYATGLSGNFAGAATAGTGTATLNLSFGKIEGDSLTAFFTFTAAGGARLLNASGDYLKVATPIQTFSAGDEVNLVCGKIDGGTNSITAGSAVRVTTAKRDNYAATAAPTADDDEGDGYAVGSIWIDLNTDEVYVCADVSAAAAVWKRVTDKAVLSNSNRWMTASVTASDEDEACSTAMAASPESAVEVLVNGAKVPVGDGAKDQFCYFSSDGGTTPRALTAIVSGDKLYWMGSIANYELDGNDRIDFVYEV